MAELWWFILLVLLFGGGVGNFIRTEINKRQERQRELTHGPDPVCGCGHHYAYHNAKNGQCAAASKQPTKWDGYGDETKWERVQCACQRYVGPQPLETLYMPEITSGVVEEEQA